MRNFYHVARKDISQYEIIELLKNDYSIESDDFYSKNEFQSHKLQLFPDGISNHGLNYLHHLFEVNNSTQNNELVSFTIESFFELVRRHKFPNIKSRFVSFFGSLTIEDSKRMRTDFFKNEGSIYKVSCENFFIADMSLINLRGSIIGMDIIAEKYWSGKCSNNPIFEVLMEYPIIIGEKVL